jgi:UDP-N-acetylmuramoylalanine--D-glutamate ligase
MMNSKNEFSASHIAVAGFGKSGRALLDFLLEENRYETLYLFNDTEISSPVEKEFKNVYEKKGVNFIIGGDRFSQLENTGLVILSPGINGRTERFDRLRQKGIAIISEIEFASRYIKAPIIAVTGTNGKSTTVSLIHHILGKCGFKSFLAGNIGNPLIAEVRDIPENAVVVVELSSFQLEEIVHFRPHIALILNVTPDHLDRYKDVEEYFFAKVNIGKNQDRSDYLILNGDDPLLRNRGESMGNARKIWFTRENRIPGELACGARLETKGTEYLIRFSMDDIDETISLAKNPLRGVHNLENLLAAASAARLMGASAAGIAESIEDFKGLPHRVEPAGKIGNVEYINDSKATNVDAALKSVSGFDSPMVLILGGKDKGGDFTLLRDVIKEKVNHVLLVGYAAREIHRQLKDLDEKFVYVADFSEAVSKGYQLLEKTGGVVLLAPGCASFDMFDNFEHRGRVFIEEVTAFGKKIANNAQNAKLKE